MTAGPAVADAIVFGSPTYMGNVSAGFQTFAEATSQRCVRGDWRDKVAAGFTNSGGKSGDKLHALTSLVVLASEHDLNRLGFFLGAGAQTDVGVSADQVHRADLLTCHRLGIRVAEVTAQLLAGKPAIRTPAPLSSVP